VPARTGLILPYGVRVGAAMLVETTCELVSRDGDSVLLRPTQGGDEVVLATDRPVTTSRGVVHAADDRVTVRLPGGPVDEPFRVTVG
jgi:beta-galactosidase